MRVWVVAELEGEVVVEASRETLGEAAELARPDRPAVVAVGSPDSEATLASLAGSGAGRIVLLQRGGPGGPEGDAAALAAWLAPVASSGPLVVLLSHTRYGRAVAPPLAVALDAGLAPDAVGVRRAPDGALEVTRPAYGGRLYASVRAPAGGHAIVTLRPGAIGIGPPEPGRTVPVERHAASVSTGIRVSRRRRLIPPDPRTVDLREAERIVAGGRGLGGPDGVRVLQELADLLGAAVGGSRVVVDLGWLPWERQIGQSGRTVAPRLYLACGISGASQHVAGIREAATIVAINSDRSAPILGMAHLGIVGDWRAIVETLIERLRARQPAAALGGER